MSYQSGLCSVIYWNGSNANCARLFVIFSSGTWIQHQTLTRGPRSIPDPLLSVDSLLQYNITILNHSAGINYTFYSIYYHYYGNCWYKHNSHIAGAVFVDVTDDLTKLLQPLPQLAGLWDAQVDALLVMKLYLKPQLVLSKAYTQENITLKHMII